MKESRPPRRIDNLYPKLAVLFGTSILFVVTVIVVFISFNLYHFSGKDSDVRKYLYGDRDSEGDKSPINIILTIFLVGPALLTVMLLFTVSMWKLFAKYRTRTVVAIVLLVAVVGLSYLLSFLFPPEEYNENYFFGTLPIVLSILWFPIKWIIFFALEFFTGNYFRHFRFRKQVAVIDLVLTIVSFVVFLFLIIVVLLDDIFTDTELRVITGVLVLAELVFLFPLTIFKTLQLFIYEGDHNINFILTGIFNEFTMTVALLTITYAWKLVVPFSPVRNTFTIADDPAKKSTEETRSFFQQIRANIGVSIPGGGFTKLEDEEEGEEEPTKHEDSDDEV